MSRSTKIFKSWIQTLREQCTYWHNMKFNYPKHDVEQFGYDKKVFGKMIGMSDEQILEHFRELFTL